jgi:Holliday junction resolvase RusA-like endonuclease
MPRNKKKVQLRVSGFYDGGLIRLDDVEIPSKRVGYKQQDGVLVAKVPLGVPEFEAAIAATFGGSNKSGWPLKGRLLVAISVELPKSNYASKDVDNMAKSILDAFCGIAYDDDKQIDALYVSKCVSPKWRAWIAIKSLGDSPKTWFSNQ